MAETLLFGGYIKRPTGQEMFDGLSDEEQDALVGPEKAQLLREGKLQLSDLVERNTQKEGPDFISSKPLKDAQD